MATQNGTRRVTTTLIIGVMVSLSVTGLMVGQTLASQGADIVMMKARQDRYEAHVEACLSELKEAIVLESRQRSEDQKETRAYLIDILREAKRK
jgi:hypothetical protein